jgi:hypothetical protein
MVWCTGAAVSRCVNKLFCCGLDLQTAKLFDRQPGGDPLWAQCAIPSNNVESPFLMFLRSQPKYLDFLHFTRYRRWTPECGAEVSV